MQALMLAAGMGKRLGRYTQNGTKCMVQVNGKALIEYAIESLVKNRIKRFVIVVGYKSDILKKFIASKFDDSNLDGMKIEYIENPVYDSTNNIYSLYLARNEMEKDDTILLESDIIYKQEIITQLIKSKEKNLAVVSHFEPWMDGTCALLDNDNDIVGLLDKAHFNWKDTARYYKTVNIYKFSADFSKQYYVPFLEAYQKAFGKNEYYEQVLKALSFLSSTTLKGMIVSGDAWYEIDDPADLSIAENRFAPAKKKIEQLSERYGGYWRFPQMKDFCYLVTPFFPPKTMVEELSSNFETLLTQYPSGAAEQSLLAAKIFNLVPEHIAVGNGAAELISSIGKFIHGKTAIPYPTFNEYTERFADSKTVAVPTSKDFSYTSKDILKVAEQENVQQVLLINPDNPSGHFMSKNDVLSLCAALRKSNSTLIFDESFIDFAEATVRYSLLDEDVLAKNPNLIVIKSISKSYGVPGLRLGVIASSNISLINDIRKTNAIWNINSFAEYFLQIYDKYKKFYAASCDSIVYEREHFVSELSKIKGIKVFPSQANFILCRLTSGISASELTRRLLEKDKIFIKDLSHKKCFEDGTYIRLSVRNSEDNDMLVSALKKIVL
jgi:histidinol-phosphate/aromatic aminotransferase/cobyric acid decarboxylase-like protein/choline kinase